MQALIDVAPLAAFLVAYLAGGIYVATAVLMLAMLALLLIDWLRLQRLPPMHLLSAVLVLVLGGATLVLRDPRFLKWKPTIFLWLVALASLASPWIGRTPLAQRLLALYKAVQPSVVIGGFGPSVTDRRLEAIAR